MSYIIPQELKKYCHISVLDKTLVHAKSMPYTLMDKFEAAKQEYETLLAQGYFQKSNKEN